MKKLSSTFLRGLVAILPITITLYLLYWIGSSAEAVLGAVISWLLPPQAYLPGMGLATGLVLVFLLGVLLRAYLVRKLLDALERLVFHIPLVKSIYGAAQDLMSFFSRSRESDMGQVVSAPVGPGGYHILGFVTREQGAELPRGLAGDDLVAVYFPMSYQIGGYTVFLPREVLQPVDMPVDEAMRFALTAGLSGGRENHPAQPHQGKQAN
ncbi:DUF502 domain-containing protein [Alkalilimnicola sp. S0819]|uniref:DUF502 domain-containing protein n=1 Tax=Alkalilimnicola sp. S0819 TaxID=2613922 RepID=UPI001262073F|nr:DUF502 domain-containing protein [Alkalilimnicola sp. S0819]KAB7627234.1 DUF502 domain-containing protein [Alkalilimnicola sp. S0819]MPQ15947.1 DUF502 domain-containing protein [Alkalilimnicola sp. S0819]